MKMTDREFHLIITGLLIIILVVNIHMKFYYHNEVIEYFLDIIFFTIFGMGIGDHIKKLIITK